MRLAHQQRNQTYILKLNTTPLRMCGWKLDLKISEIRQDATMVVSLGSSQMLRWLEQIQGKTDNDARATQLKCEIKALKKGENNAETKKKISKLYDELYETQFEKNYIMVHMDTPTTKSGKNKDYDELLRRTAKGHPLEISFDGGEPIKYKRLFGTVGGIKKSTIVFVNEKYHKQLMELVDNGRDVNKKFIPAKLNAYRALTCSASIAVPWPRMIVVNDGETQFIEHNATIVRCSTNPDDENFIYDPKDSTVEPFNEKGQEYEVNYTFNDGFGFMSPQYATVLAEALHDEEPDRPLGAVNTRCSFTKGMLFTFDFVEFGREHGGYIVKDCWGNMQDVRNADVILTESQLKLTSSYKSCEDYVENCKKNGYEFCVVKTAPRKLRDIHTTNYQYLQDFSMTDEQIERLIEPTVSRIKDILSLDWRKTLIYTCGDGLNERNVKYVDPMYKAIMACPDVMNDDYVHATIADMIRRRIQDAKLAVLDIAGDYAIVGGDLYAFAESVWGLEPKGLLKAGEIYHKTWYDKGSEEVVMFRAPMTSINNVCKAAVVATDEMKKWYQYVDTCCIINAWDTIAMRLNGMDCDGDTVFSTDNEVLRESFVYKPTLVSQQMKMDKIIPTVADFVASEKNGFGDSIGTITNFATNMISLREQFEPDSEEYHLLSERIDTMMEFQQNAIDRIKGIEAKDIPAHWKTRRTCGDDELLRSVCVEQKPYFFIYRYQTLKNEYDKFVKEAEANCQVVHGMSIEELRKVATTEEEKNRIKFYDMKMPVSDAPGTINKICHSIEREFDNVEFIGSGSFDYSILKSGNPYNQSDYDAIEREFKRYNKQIKAAAAQYSAKKSQTADRIDDIMGQLNDIFAENCAKICPNESVLADIMVDVCYKNGKKKGFLWQMCGEQIVKNIINRTKNTLKYPVLDPDGDIIYYGKHYRMAEMAIGGEKNVDFE